LPGWGPTLPSAHAFLRARFDDRLLDGFLELGLRARIQTAANGANAIEKLRRLRPADDSVSTEYLIAG